MSQDWEDAMREKTIFSGAATLAVALVLSGCVETTTTPGAAVSSSACPSNLGANECEYYRDGYALGVQDRGMGMSMAYERHDGYDSTFEPYFASGYNAGWSASG
jgi:hypothetical protein